MLVQTNKRKRSNNTIEADMINFKQMEYIEQLANRMRLHGSASPAQTVGLDWNILFEGYYYDGQLKNHPVIIDIHQQVIDIPLHIHNCELSCTVKCTLLHFLLNVWDQDSSNILTYLFKKGYEEDIKWVYEIQRNARYKYSVPNIFLKIFFSTKPDSPINNEWLLKLKIFEKYIGTYPAFNVGVFVREMMHRETEVEVFLQIMKENVFASQLISNEIANGLLIHEYTGSMKYKIYLLDFLIKYRFKLPYNDWEKTINDPKIIESAALTYKQLVFSCCSDFCSSMTLVRFWDRKLLVEFKNRHRIKYHATEAIMDSMGEPTKSYLNEIKLLYKNMVSNLFFLDIPIPTDLYNQYRIFQNKIAKLIYDKANDEKIEECFLMTGDYYSPYKLFQHGFANFIRTCKNPLFCICKSAADDMIWSNILMYVALSPVSERSYKKSEMGHSLLFKIETLVESTKIYMLDAPDPLYEETYRIIHGFKGIYFNPTLRPNYCDYMLKRVMVPRVLHIIFKAMKKQCFTSEAWDHLLELNKEVIRKGNDTIIELTEKYTNWQLIHRVMTIRGGVINSLKDGTLHKVYAPFDEVTFPRLNLDTIPILPGFFPPEFVFVPSDD